jgi:signal peptidase I
MRRRLFVLVAGVGWVLFRLARPFRVVVAGESMRPTLAPGDQLLAIAGGTVRRGDVVVVRAPDREIEMVKRVAGVPGDRVRIGDEDRMLGPDEFLVVGDDPDRSTDGRSFGPVSASAVAGVVVLRYLPRPALLRR